MPKTIELKHPLQTHQGETHSLVLRDPNAGDYMQLNDLPFRMIGTDTTQRMQIDFQLAGKWLTRLSGVDEILMSKMNQRDFMNCVNGLADHLMSEGDTGGNSAA